MRYGTLLTISVIFFLQSPISNAEHSSELAISAGTFNAFDDNSTVETGIEYRFSPMKLAYNLIPVIGITANADGGYWMHSGIRYSISLNQKWMAVPHIAVCLYENGDGKDLGQGLQFRSGLEVAHKLNTNSRLGLGLYHISNARLGSKNPDEESIILSYSFSK